MSTQAKLEYLLVLARRYRDADINEKTLILSEIQTNLGIHRKSAIRRMNQILAREKLRAQGIRFRKKTGRKRVYLPETIWHLKRIWHLTDYICAKKLHRAMREWLKFYAPKKVLDSICVTQLVQMSPATIDRMLRPYRAQIRRRKNTATKPGKFLKNIVPLKAMGNVAAQVGIIEVDTVAHCGGNMGGEFIHSITFSDTFSGYTLNRAIWGKSAARTKEAIEYIESILPFPIQSINVDNGSEFLNHHLVEYFSPQNKKKNRSRFLLTRSRSYRKNDNCHVEQKNYTTVRQIFGYERLEWEELIPIMNKIYKIQNQFTNHFIPQFKLKSKVRVGAKIKRKYDEPKTPYERLMLDPLLADEFKQKLKMEHEALNPISLREEREELLKQFTRMKNKLKCNDSGHLKLVSSKTSAW